MSMQHTALAVVAPEALKETIAAALGDKAKRIDLRLGEVTVIVTAQNYLEAARILKDHEACKFEQLIDLCGLDYSEYRAGEWDGLRYAVATHLLSVSLNQRVRLKVFAPDDELPVVDSLTGVWNGANWFEREAFDLYGIVFEGHDDLPVVDSLTGLWGSANWFEREAFDLYGIVFEGHSDLRRILTDYGFIGHPFRKDFPVSGHVEMRYDPEQKRVIYQPVTIEPREITPRIIREEKYGGLQ